MDKASQMIKDIEKNGVAGKGRKEMLRHLFGERLTIRQMAIAKCYDCMGFYSDGRGTDCKIPTCPLYPIMPYKEGKKYSRKDGNPMSEERKAKIRSVGK